MCASDSRITEKSLGSTSKGPRVASIGTTDKMDVEQPVIDDTLVRRMVAAQFPQWADLPVRSAAVGGWDNKTFHLGEHMIARGYLPQTTYSAHYIADPDLRRAISDYLKRERAYVAEAARELIDAAPFRKTD